MEQPIDGIAIYLLAGMQAKIKAPVDFLRGTGWFVKTGTQQLGNLTKTLVNGFCVEDDAVGEIEAVTNEAAVVYTHRKAEKNTIWFFAKTGEVGICSVISVPIHDHSSIVSGGPGYASFFSDDEKIE